MLKRPRREGAFLCLRRRKRGSLDRDYKCVVLSRALDRALYHSTRDREIRGCGGSANIYVPTPVERNAGRGIRPAPPDIADHVEGATRRTHDRNIAVVRGSRCTLAEVELRPAHQWIHDWQVRRKRFAHNVDVVAAVDGDAQP